MNKQDIDKLFTAFYTTKQGGMGIGLSVSRSIIESHGGRLHAALNDGLGAYFSFDVPVWGATDPASVPGKNVAGGSPAARANDTLENT